MNNNTYKVFQLMEYFITKYDYISFRVNGIEKDDEILIASKTNPNFQVIRICQSSTQTLLYDKERLEAYKNIIKQQFNLNDVKLLDVHIIQEEPDGDEDNLTVCLDSNYHKGKDISVYYPGIYDVIHDVNDSEVEIRERVSNINNTFLKLKEAAKKRPLKTKLKELHAPVTLSVCLISILLFVLTVILTSKYDLESALIILGAQYNTFTVGLFQIYRLLINAFLHSSLMHLFFNLFAFYYVGIIVEKRLQSKKYLILLLAGIIFSSISSGILSINTITIGLSGGIYCIFIYYLMSLIGSGFLNVKQIMPTIIINVMLNFVPGVSWQAHLGGAVCGILFYYVYNEKKKKKNMIILVMSILVLMNIKYFLFTPIKPLYLKTDAKVVSVYKDIGLNSYSENIAKRLINVYQKGA